MPKPLSPYPNISKPHIPLIPHISLFVKHIKTMDYIPNISVCQVHFVPKSYDKMSKNLEKIGSFVIFYFKRYKKISKPPQKEFVWIYGVCIGGLGYLI